MRIEVGNIFCTLRDIKDKEKFIVQEIDDATSYFVEGFFFFQSIY